MKRTEFIQNIGLLGVGFTLIPWKFVSANSTVRVYALPKPAVHIPHGNFASSELEKLFLPDLNLECTVQQFMRNGIEQNENDLTVYSFKRDDEILTIGFTRSGKTTFDGNISGLKQNLYPRAINTFPPISKSEITVLNGSKLLLRCKESNSILVLSKV